MSAPTVHGDRLGVITGTGLGAVDLLDDACVRELVVRGRRIALVDEGSVVLLGRHGLHHETPAHLVDHHANVTALVEAGCDRVVSFTSVGSLRVELGVGTVVCPDDCFGLDVAPSFHDDTNGHGVPGFDLAWRRSILEVWGAEASRPVRDGGTYAQTRGPRFETPAEVRWLATVADVVGMTAMSEMILAREAGLAHAAICEVDNLANGIDAQPLRQDEFWDQVAEQGPRRTADIRAALPVLAATPRLPGGAP
jgi:5'-methylthioadenosine phosphorylase